MLEDESSAAELLSSSPSISETGAVLETEGGRRLYFTVHDELELLRHLAPHLPTSLQMDTDKFKVK